MVRKDKLIINQIHHIFNKSIAEYKIFNDNKEYIRIRDMVRYYQVDNMQLRFSYFSRKIKGNNNGFDQDFFDLSKGKEKLVQIIAYCIMPTHIHLILKQLKKNGISIFMANVLNSYSRYFNTKYKRKGPLWEGRFKNVLVDNADQLIHLTRYVHLNPATAHLVENPEEWKASSYNEYLSKDKGYGKICEFEDILDVKPGSYRNFVEERISDQRELAKMKDMVID